MNDNSSSTPFTISSNRSKEIRETVKQTLNNIMKKVEEYSSLAVICKEVSMDFCNNKIQFRLLKQQYISLTIKIKYEINSYKSFLEYIKNEGFEDEIDNWFIFNKTLTLSSIKEKLEKIEDMIDYDFTVKMSILDSLFIESNPDTLSIYISTFISSPGFDEVFINNFKSILQSEFK